MALSNAARQAAYRADRTRARAALRDIIGKLKDNQKSLAVELRTIAMDGLGMIDE